MFYDEAQISVKGGHGGDGCVSFRHESMTPRGGPDGGNGGRGGDVILRVNRHFNTLQHFQHQALFEAEMGKYGKGKDMTGRSADALFVNVPPGTVVRDQKTNDILADLTLPDSEYIAARGGRGGRGNATFATSTNQAPEIATLGSPGEERVLTLELKIIADIGLVGMPNAGKSTLISVLTDAKPKIANYPFTTLVPNLGVARVGDLRTIVIADIPGLIEGASQGKGLGDEFLRHIERTRVLIHLIDGESEDPLKDFETVNAELKAFGHGLAEKPQVIGMSKMDLPDARAAFELFVHKNIPDVIAFSSASNENVRLLLNRAVQILDDLPPLPVSDYTPVITMDTEDDYTFTIKRTGGGWRVNSRYLEERAKITRWDLDEATQRFQIALDRSGVGDALLKAGIQPGDIVFIADGELEWQDESQMDFARKRN